MPPGLRSMEALRLHYDCLSVCLQVQGLWRPALFLLKVSDGVVRWGLPTSRHVGPCCHQHTNTYTDQHDMSGTAANSTPTHTNQQACRALPPRAHTHAYRPEGMSAHAATSKPTHIPTRRNIGFQQSPTPCRPCRGMSGRHRGTRSLHFEFMTLCRYKVNK